MLDAYWKPTDTSTSFTTLNLVFERPFIFFMAQNETTLGFVLQLMPAVGTSSLPLRP